MQQRTHRSATISSVLRPFVIRRLTQPLPRTVLLHMGGDKPKPVQATKASMTDKPVRHRVLLLQHNPAGCVTAVPNFCAWQNQGKHKTVRSQLIQLGPAHVTASDCSAAVLLGSTAAAACGACSTYQGQGVTVLSCNRVAALLKTSCFALQ
jgi:hypothetical protein